MFGIFPHKVNDPRSKLLRGFDDRFFVPHSRHTEVRKEDICKAPQLEILSESSKAGVYIIVNRDGRQIFITGHSEYDPHTLKREYDRDVAKGLDIGIPENYYEDDDPSKPPVVTWRAMLTCCLPIGLTITFTRRLLMTFRKYRIDTLEQERGNEECLVK